ncbi:phage holin family protein [Citrobacter sp. ESBL3]
MSVIISSEPALKYIIELETILAIIIVSAWGGVVSYLMREARGRKKKNIAGCLK